MRFEGRKHRFFHWILLLCLVFACFVAFFAGGYLVIDDPDRSDVIVVLAGETEKRPAKGLEMLNEDYAPFMILDVPAVAKIYDVTQLEIARQYVQKQPRAPQIGICPIAGLSTRGESHDVAKCLSSIKSGRVLIVTSDYHTRRALSIFRHELKGRTFSSSAARNPVEYGVLWWKHREWAKTFVSEWAKLIWWKAVDAWR